ncbi:MAG: serine hydrolase domain-containing protein [Rhodoglobus sp.]
MRLSRRAGPAILAAALAVVLAGCATAPPAQPRAGVAVASAEAARADRIAEQSRLSDSVIESLVPDDGPGCSAAVAMYGRVIWAGAAGLADIDGGIPMTTDTRFEMGSVSKQFTATAILMLQREGLLSLSDTIGTYVDGMPDWADTITLDQLIHHTSRIPDFWVELDSVGIGFTDPADQATTLAAIARETELEPGSGYTYSNSNYVLLAEVVARVSGMPLADFLAERIFSPLDLDIVLAPGLDAPDIALSYDDAVQLQEGGWTSYGHVGIISTPSELAKWGDQYRAGDIIQDDFLVGAVDEGAGEVYAAGMDVEVDGDLNHTGRWGGYISDFTVSADRTKTIVVACNGHRSDRFGIVDALWAIWDPHSAE